MNSTPVKVGFGGGCHWCTEAVFQQLQGVLQVDQGWASSTDAPSFFSEAVIVHFDPAVISLEVLTSLHLHTHSCTSRHALRTRYRSAVYGFGESQVQAVAKVLEALQADFDDPLVTEAVLFSAFRQNSERYQDYYQRQPEAPFCQRYISPKLEVLQKQYAQHVRPAPTRYNELTPEQPD